MHTNMATSDMAADTGLEINLYGAKKIDQRLTASVTRILIEDYKQTRGTTELAATHWKKLYTKVRDAIESDSESDLIAALTDILNRYKGQSSVNGVISMTLVKSCKNLLELRRETHKELKTAKIKNKDKYDQQPARIQARRDLDEKRINDAEVYKTMTTKVKLTPEEIEDIKNTLNGSSKRTVVGYEMYERAGSLQNLQEDLEKQLNMKIQLPEIMKLTTPYLYRRKEEYCGRSTWFNEQILPPILIRAVTEVS